MGRRAKAAIQPEPSSGRESGRPNPVDAHVGARVRLRRTLLGLSQEKLGAQLGLTFQQVQKYEHGANRISASRLHALSTILDVPVSFFFDDLDPNAVPLGLGGDPVVSEDTEGASAATRRPPELDPLAKRETVDLVRAYYQIVDPAVRKRIFELAKAAALVSTAEPMSAAPAHDDRRT
jgi:transcriptional regulator with XRE-family HTH domain